MPTLEEWETIDVYKDSVYKLCDFLIKRRQSVTGIGITAPLHIPLREMEVLFEYINVDTAEEKIQKIKSAIELLKDNSVQDGAPTAIVIKNPDILTDFSSSFQDNRSIIIGCSTEGLEAFQKKLRALTQKMEIDGVGFSLKEMDGNQIRISFGDRGLTITRGNRGDFPLKLNIVLLLFGRQITVLATNNERIGIRSFTRELFDRIGERSSDYRHGNFISIKALVLILSYARDHVSFTGHAQDAVITRKAVVTALKALEEDTTRELTRPLIQRNDGNVSLNIQ